MSGGVDSSLAAAALKQASYEVSGVHMELWAGRATTDLDRTCQTLDIPLYKVNFEAELDRLVVSYFCREYSLGRTPNPCVACNRYIKFGLLLDWAQQRGADYLASGHYARTERTPDGYRLLRAVDPAKDQSYFLYPLGQKELQKLILPLGYLQKAEVREMAARLELPASSRRESQDICFIPDRDYRSFVARRIPLKAGDIVGARGQVLGKHSGLARYTVGQRQGLGLASNERLYVIKLDAPSNRLVVGSEDELWRDTLLATNLSWVSGKAPDEPVTITAKVRYRSPEVPATLHIRSGAAEVRFHQPQRAIAPGQAVVFYQGDTVLGGGTIEDADTIL